MFQLTSSEPIDLHPRLFLVTPASYKPDEFLPQLEAALAAGDVACLLVTRGGLDDVAFQKVAARMVEMGQAAGAAVLIGNDTRIAGRARADGIHCDTGLADLKLATETFKPSRIVGAGGIKTRHEAMELAETGVDYVFFGLLDLDESPEAHRKTLDLADWWSELFEIPCVALGGTDLASVGPCAATGADFVALRDGVWTYPEGPAAAVRLANETLASYELEAAEE
ncbi:thiamine phosphate synthase [Stappia sp. F7233]|uniref:Thiamine phosphate synthase n=1 Tax=Stappia albiluteola TaxID=2758565 RepID=A0A839AC33_9HYPH|nr:thiamine phosphate synthase [Stappia albiluteola]